MNICTTLAKFTHKTLERSCGSHTPKVKMACAIFVGAATIGLTAKTALVAYELLSGNCGTDTYMSPLYSLFGYTQTCNRSVIQAVGYLGATVVTAAIIPIFTARQEPTTITKQVVAEAQGDAPKRKMSTPQKVVNRMVVGATNSLQKSGEAAKKLADDIKLSYGKSLQ